MREVVYDVRGHKCRHISCFSDVKFDYVAKMDVPDLGDMVRAKWIIDWNIPDPAQGGIAEYRKIRQMIADKIHAELPQLLAGSGKMKRVAPCRRALRTNI